MKTGKRLAAVLLLFGITCGYVGSLPVSDKVCSFQIRGSVGPSGIAVSVHCLGPEAVALTVAPILGPFVSEFTGTAF